MQFQAFQWRTKTENREITQRPVVKAAIAELLQLRQHFLRMFGVGAGIARQMRGVEAARLVTQPFRLVVGFHLDAMLVSPQVKGVFNEQFGSKAFFQCALRIAGPVRKAF